MTSQMMFPGIDDGTFERQMAILARQVRDLTQEGLAKTMGVAQSTVSKFEAGVLQPSDEELRKLADALELPIDFFTQRRRIPGPGLSELFHRKRQSLGAKKLHHIHAEAAMRLLALQDLLRSWPEGENEEEGIPNLQIESFDSKPEKIARTVRALWQLPPGPVANLTEVIESFGGIIFVCDFGTDQIDGFSRRWDDVPPAFFLSASLQPDRWRWTLAHELGHMVMHVGVTDGSEKDREEEANRFAGEFLAPAHELKPQLFGLTIPKLAGLKRYWKISIQALLTHARRLGVLTENQLRNMMVQLSRAGYRKREPAELDPPAEPPHTLERILRFHQDELGYSEEELLDALKIGYRDFRLLVRPTEPKLRAIS